MHRKVLGNIILKTLNVFDFFQFVDDAYEKNDSGGQSLLKRFFLQRYEASPEQLIRVFPLAQFPTTLTILTVPVFASTMTNDERQEVWYSMMGDDNARRPPSRVVRRAGARGRRCLEASSGDKRKSHSLTKRSTIPYDFLKYHVV